MRLLTAALDLGELTQVLITSLLAAEARAPPLVGPAARGAGALRRAGAMVVRGLIRGVHTR